MGAESPENGSARLSPPPLHGFGVADRASRLEPMSTVIAAIRSIVTYVVVALYVLLMGPPFLLIALIVGSPRLLYSVGLWGVRLGLFLSGVRMERHGLEHLQHDRAAVYAVNHASNVEPCLIFDVLHELFPRLRILYKAELRKLPILVRAFDLAGFVPLERGNGRRVSETGGCELLAEKELRSNDSIKLYAANVHGQNAPPGPRDRFVESG